MEAVMGVLLIVGIVIWAFTRNPTVGEPRVGERPARPVLTEPASHPEDGAFFDGYIWGRLQERHDERQHGGSEGHDHGVFDGDDCFDHDG